MKFGIFTPTETAVVAVVYSLFVGMFIYREIKIKELYVPMHEVIKGVWPFLLSQIVVLGMLIAFPALVMVPAKETRTATIA